MDIILDVRVKKIIKSFPEIDRSRISGYIDLFSINGFNMTSKYLKKIDNNYEKSTRIRNMDRV